MKVNVIKISVLSSPGPAAKIGNANTPEPIAAPATMKDERSSFLKLSTIINLYRSAVILQFIIIRLQSLNS